MSGIKCAAKCIFPLTSVSVVECGIGVEVGDYLLQTWLVFHSAAFLRHLFLTIMKKIEIVLISGSSLL